MFSSFPKDLLLYCLIPLVDDASSLRLSCRRFRDLCDQIKPSTAALRRYYGRAALQHQSCVMERVFFLHSWNAEVLTLYRFADEEVDLSLASVDQLAFVARALSHMIEVGHRTNWHEGRVWKAVPPILTTNVTGLFSDLLFKVPFGGRSFSRPETKAACLKKLAKVWRRWDTLGSKTRILSFEPDGSSPMWERYYFICGKSMVMMFWKMYD